MYSGICINPVIPIRATPTEKSEMIDQLLFGETFLILKNGKDWKYIKRVSDEYEGWLNSIHFVECSEEYLEKIEEGYSYILAKPFNRLTTGNDPLQLPAGSRLPFFNKQYKTSSIASHQYTLHEDFDASQTDKRKFIKNTAFQFMNAPYLWGGKTVFGIDCSGFTQILYRIAGINIPRDSHQQVKNGKTIPFVKDAREADLAFFGDEEKGITHTGIIINNESLIHASGKVRVDAIDHQGIYNNELKKYTHKLRVVKRLID